MIVTAPLWWATGEEKKDPAATGEWSAEDMTEKLQAEKVPGTSAGSTSPGSTSPGNTLPGTAPGVAASATEEAATAPQESSARGAAGSQGPWTQVAEIPLPPALLWARDLRWLGDSRFVFSVQDTGVLLWDSSRPEAPRRIAARGDGSREIWLPDAVAASGEHFVVSAPVLSLGWGKLDSKTGALEGLHAMEHVSDLDLRADRVLLLGAQRGESGRFAPDGAIAWLGPVDGEPSSSRPVLYSMDGEGARSVDRCGMMMVGAARFLEDGSFVLVPGTEEGVFHFDENARLLRTWTSEAVGFDAGCSVSEDEVLQLSSDERSRWAWVNQRRTVDEILPLAEGPGLVVREVRRGEVRWRLRVLKEEGASSTAEAPVTSPSPLARLEGDLAGDRIALLLWTWGLPPEGPSLPPRLVISSLAR